jgi:hypothetical protein
MPTQCPRFVQTISIALLHATNKIGQVAKRISLIEKCMTTISLLFHPHMNGKNKVSCNLKKTENEWHRSCKIDGYKLWPWLTRCRIMLLRHYYKSRGLVQLFECNLRAPYPVYFFLCCLWPGA